MFYCILFFLIRIVDFQFTNFVLYCNGVHRDLHSFPTRRSSDLRTPAPSCGSLTWPPDAPPTVTASSCRPMRSEEHTSELQSRGHLVCRLLLEKKKKVINTNIEKLQLERDWVYIKEQEVKNLDTD